MNGWQGGKKSSEGQEKENGERMERGFKQRTAFLRISLTSYWKRFRRNVLWN